MNADYRSGARCEFCEELAVTACARCQCHVCNVHVLPGAAYCKVCQKEQKDEADLAKFSSSITTQAGNRDYLGRPRISLLEMLVSWLGRVIFRKSKPRETPFGQRTPEQIRIWRRSAGVRVRS